MSAPGSESGVFEALRKCEDVGFHNVLTAQFLRERLEASIIRSRASIANSLNFIDQRVQHGPGVRPVDHKRGDLRRSYRQGMIAQRAIAEIGCDEMREDQLLERVDAILQFIELALADFGHDGDSVAVDNEPEPTGPEQAPHRFDGVAK